MIDFFWESHRPILFLKRQQKVHPAKRFEILRSRQHGLMVMHHYIKLSFLVIGCTLFLWRDSICLLFVQSFSCHRLPRMKQGNAWDKSCLMTKPMHHGKNHAVWVLPCHDLSHGGIAKPMDLICCYGMSFAMPSPFPWGYNNNHECHTLVYPWILYYPNPI